MKLFKRIPRLLLDSVIVILSALALVYLGSVLSYVNPDDYITLEELEDKGKILIVDQEGNSRGACFTVYEFESLVNRIQEMSREESNI